VSKYVATIGVDYGVKPIKIRGTEIRVNFWDLAGGEEYAEIRNEFYKDAQGVRAFAAPSLRLRCRIFAVAAPDARLSPRRSLFAHRRGSSSSM
jgi:hypothetical protein